MKELYIGTSSLEARQKHENLTVHKYMIEDITGWREDMIIMIKCQEKYFTIERGVFDDFSIITEIKNLSKISEDCRRLSNSRKT